MWPAFAKKVGIDPNSVTFVNISPPAKVAALKSKAVDIISDFYNEHDLKAKEFGADLGFLPWRSWSSRPTRPQAAATPSCRSTSRHRRSRAGASRAPDLRPAGRSYFVGATVCEDVVIVFEAPVSGSTCL